MKLESFQIEHQTTGEKKNIFGEKPNGYFIFTPQKRMMALLKTEGRKQPNTDRGPHRGLLVDGRIQWHLPRRGRQVDHQG